MTVKEVLSRWFAIYISAKRYHWKTCSSLFMSDHLLFDRIAECWSKKLNDAIVEKYFMGAKRELLNEVDSIFEDAPKYVAPALECKTVADSTQMCLALYSILEDLIKGIQDCDGEDRGVNAELDVVASNLATAKGLLLGRIAYKAAE